MDALEVLRLVRLGSSVAEHDTALARYFVETETFRRIVRDECDVISGDKGTGKTALFKILSARYTSIDSLQETEVIPAFNITGSPVFDRLNTPTPLSEDQYKTLWKSYFLSLAGNWVLSFYDDDLSKDMEALGELLNKTGLRSAEDSAETVFSKVAVLWKRITNPKSVSTIVSATPDGIPIVTASIEFDRTQADEELDYLPESEAFGLLERILEDCDISLWLVLDRLDEAFAGRPAAEIPALRALFRTYLDLLAYPHIRLKLFVRNDLFRRITAGGFVNLTHVEARRITITWDEESLYDLLHRRLRDSPEFLDALGASAGDVVNALLPPQVDVGAKKPTTWKWLMARIVDGNGVRPPRHLIDLMQKSVDAAIRREEREKSTYEAGVPLLRSEDIRQGLRALSEQVVNSTLISEAGDEGYLIDRFRGGKAEHNDESLSTTLRMSGDDLAGAVEFLRQIGFLREIRETSTKQIPMLYRHGLGVTQGKAFAAASAADEDDEEE